MPRPTILFVEDDADTRTIFQTALEAAKYEVVAIAAAADAPGMTETLAIDAVIMDIGVRGEHLGIAAQLASAAHPPKLIAVTGLTPKSHPGEALFTAYLLKPILPEDLVDAVESVMRR